MRLLKTEVAQYALLLILLFAIASIAVNETISYFGTDLRMDPSDFRVLVVMLWALSLGFMAIAGAFGLWGIKVSAEGESRRRISQLVNAMDYILDGVLLLDRRGRITGSNPAARRLAAGELERVPQLEAAFPSLSDEDSTLLRGGEEPHEVERQQVENETARVLRFRSVPSGSLSLITISDVTAMNEQQLRRRHAARLALIGEISKGVADDFNELLGSITCSASTIPRLRPESPDFVKALKTISESAERGIVLAEHLQKLAGTGVAGHGTDAVSENVRDAVESLRDSLSTEWRIETAITDNLPPVALTRIQVEQVVLNLGLLAAETAKRAGILTVMLAAPGQRLLTNVQGPCACVLVVAASGSLSIVQEPVQDAYGNARERSGVIQSVVKSIVAEPGGSLDTLRTADGTPVYRVVLPLRRAAEERRDAGVSLPNELRAYISGWNVLLARASLRYLTLGRRLMESRVNVIAVGDIMRMLKHVDETEKLDAMIIDEQILRDEPKALLSAILKLRPQTAVVVLSDAPESAPAELRSQISFLRDGASADQVILAMIEARKMAVKRRKN